MALPQSSAYHGQLPLSQGWAGWHSWLCSAKQPAEPARLAEVPATRCQQGGEYSSGWLCPTPPSLPHPLPACLAARWPLAGGKAPATGWLPGGRPLCIPPPSCRKSPCPRWPQLPRAATNLLFLPRLPGETEGGPCRRAGGIDAVLLWEPGAQVGQSRGWWGSEA